MWNSQKYVSNLGKNDMSALVQLTIARMPWALEQR